jgi:tRNA threonylcarbamoyladenosine biosynthesis protein TsaE
VVSEENGVGYLESSSGTQTFDWLHRVPDETSVAVLASVFADFVVPPIVFYLQGDLGAGKTTFARAFIQALGYQGYVKSPSYGLLESYEAGGMSILHLDLYRIEDPEELDYLALRDLYNENTILLVEWPDKGRFHLPAADLQLVFDEAEDTRTISCQARSDSGRKLSQGVVPLI